MSTEERQQIRDPRIFTRGTTLAEVPPDFRGISWKEWLRLVEASWKSEPQPKDWQPIEERKWYRKAVATPRDNYGWKSA